VVDAVIRAIANELYVIDCQIVNKCIYGLNHLILIVLTVDK